MDSPALENIKIYHIVHVDRLRSIVGHGFIFSHREVEQRGLPGTTIGIDRIKQRRLGEIRVSCHVDATVGNFVPFNFCPRSVMLYVISRCNYVDLGYMGGQGSIVHLEASLTASVRWAESHQLRWALASENSAAKSCEFSAALDDVSSLDWPAIRSRRWGPRPGGRTDLRAGKQAEFLVERCFPWVLVERIGVGNVRAADEARAALPGGGHCPPVEVIGDWYYE